MRGRDGDKLGHTGGVALSELPGEGEYQDIGVTLAALGKHSQSLLFYSVERARSRQKYTGVDQDIILHDCIFIV